jgi:hypothetical protein
MSTKCEEQMMKKVNRSLLTRFIREKTFRRFEHSFLDQTLDGIPVAIGKVSLLMQSIVDFQQDGMVILPIKAIVGVLDLDSYDHINCILEAEGIKTSLVASSCFNLDNVLQMMNDFMETNTAITIELSNQEDGDYIHIGHILDVTDTHITIKAVNDVGESTQEHVELSRIGAIRIQSRYMNTVLKYARVEQCSAHEKFKP